MKVFLAVFLLIACSLPAALTLPHVHLSQHCSVLTTGLQNGTEKQYHKHLDGTQYVRVILPDVAEVGVERVGTKIVACDELMAPTVEYISDESGYLVLRSDPDNINGYINLSEYTKT